MATTFHCTISTTSARVLAAEQVLEECHQVIRASEAEMSEYLPDSPVYQLNHAPDIAAVTAGESLAHVFKAAEVFRRETDNAFHYGIKGCLTPNPPFALRGSSIEKLHPQAWLGFGAIGKGYALDRARMLLAQAGFEDFCLNAGGSSILLSGFASSNEPWSWGWSWSRSDTGALLGFEFEHASGRPIAIGVSGMQEKGAHLKSANATTVFPLQSALVAANSATEADALSTALFVGGWEKFNALPAVQNRELSTAAIDHEGVPFWNGWFARWWGAVAAAVVLALPVYADDASSSATETAPIVKAAAELSAPRTKPEAPASSKALSGDVPEAAVPTADATDAEAKGVDAAASDATGAEVPIAEGASADSPTPNTDAVVLEGGSGDEAIDLGDMGGESFNPYNSQRDPLWVMLPIAALLLVVLHLKRPPKPKNITETKT